MFAQVLEASLNLAFALAVGVAREADPAWFGQPLETGGDVDPVAVDVLTLDDHVAQVDADAELEALVLVGLRLALGHPVLPGHRTGNRIHHAGKLDQQAVAHEFDDPPTVLLN